MGYRKVYLTIEEEEDIAKIKAWREQSGQAGAAFNAILKEGLALVMAQELRARSGKVRGTNEISQEPPRRRRRRGA